MRTLREISEMLEGEMNSRRTLREIGETLEGEMNRRLIAAASIEMLPQQPAEVVEVTGLPKLDFIRDEVILARWPEDEKRYFVWIDGWKGAGFVYSGEFEAQICVEDFVPKKGVLRKELLAHDDVRSMDQLKEDYPWPVVVKAAAANPYPVVLSPEQQNGLGYSSDPKKSVDVIVAKAKGYTGDACDNCGLFTMLRSGTCMRCDNCGTTTGCS